jgi:hypothetical protein
MNSGSGCLTFLKYWYSIMELTAAGTVQDFHLFPFQIAPEWNNFTKMRVKDKLFIEVGKENL